MPEIKFSLKECEDAITKLKTAKDNLNEIVVTNLQTLMDNVDSIYDGPTEKKMKDAYDVIRDDYINHFEAALQDAIDYLEKDVKTNLVDLETAASNAIQ